MVSTMTDAGAAEAIGSRGTTIAMTDVTSATTPSTRRIREADTHEMLAVPQGG